MALDFAMARSRRALLTGALGGAAATVVHALGRAMPVEAANGDTVKVGASLVGTTATTIKNTSSAAKQDGIVGRSSSTTGAGVHGTNSASGDSVLGTATTGIGAHGKVTNGAGVMAECSGSGDALIAVATGTGPGVRAVVFGDGAALRASSAHSPAVEAYAGGSDPTR